MLRIKSHSLKLFLKYPTPITYLSTTTKTLTLEQSQQNLQKILTQKIALQQQHLQNLQQYEKYFSTAGWTIKNNHTQIQLFKKYNQYNIYIFFNAKLMNAENVDWISRLKENRRQSTKQIQGLAFTEVSVFMKPNLGDKWLIADFLVTKEDNELLGIRYTTKFQQQRQLLASNKRRPQAYKVDIEDTNRNIIYILYELCEQLGLDNQFFFQVSQLGEASQQKVYIDWMKDLRSLV